MNIEKLKSMDPTTRLKTLRELYRVKDPLFDAYMSMCAGEVIEHYADTQRHLENIYQDNCEGALVQVSELDRTRQALSEVDPTNPALCAAPPSFGVWEQQRARIAALESACKVLAKAHARGTKVRCELEKRLGDDSLTVACGGYEQMCEFCDVLNDVTADPIASQYVKESK